MKFYYANNMGDCGIFSETNLIKAIYTAWNIEADLYLINADVKKLNLKSLKLSEQAKLVFAPYEENELNSSLLKEFGYYMKDGEHEREIRDIKTNDIKKYDWSDVQQLV